MVFLALKALPGVALIVLGTWVTLWPPERRRSKVAFLVAFAVLGLLVAFLDVRQSVEDAEEDKALARGVSEIRDQTRSPPRVQITVPTQPPPVVNIVPTPPQPLPRYSLGGNRGAFYAPSENWIPAVDRIDVSLDWATLKNIEVAAEIVVGIDPMNGQTPNGLAWGRIWNLTDGAVAAVTEPIRPTPGRRSTTTTQRVILRRGSGLKTYRLQMRAEGRLLVSATATIVLERFR
jgi:hypothetical protein